jgi:predicted MFS family arabinose efflux permease
LLGSVMCIMSRTEWEILMGRFVQGAGAGTITVIMAMMTDIYTGKEREKVAALFSSIWSLVPAFAPFLGGFIQHAMGWRANFGLVALYGIVAIFLTMRYLPETHPHDARTHLQTSTIAHAVIAMCKRIPFLAYCVSMIATWSIMVVFSIMTPFLFQTTMGYSARTYGLLCLIEGLAYFVGCMINIALVSRFNPRPLILIGWIGTLIGGIWLLATVYLHQFDVLHIMLPISCTVMISALVYANSWSQATQTFIPQYRGIASAMMGSFLLLGTGLVTFISSHFHINTQAPLAWIYIGLSVIGIGAYALTGKTISTATGK